MLHHTNNFRLEEYPELNKQIEILYKNSGKNFEKHKLKFLDACNCILEDILLSMKIEGLRENYRGKELSTKDLESYMKHFYRVVLKFLIENNIVYVSRNHKENHHCKHYLINTNCKYIKKKYGKKYYNKFAVKKEKYFEKKFYKQLEKCGKEYKESVLHNLSMLYLVTFQNEKLIDEKFNKLNKKQKASQRKWITIAKENKKFVEGVLKNEERTEGLEISIGNTYRGRVYNFFTQMKKNFREHTLINGVKHFEIDMTASHIQIYKSGLDQNDEKYFNFFVSVENGNFYDDLFKQIKINNPKTEIKIENIKKYFMNYFYSWEFTDDDIKINKKKVVKEVSNAIYVLFPEVHRDFYYNRLKADDSLHFCNRNVNRETEILTKVITYLLNVGYKNHLRLHDCINVGVDISEKDLKEVYNILKSCGINAVGVNYKGKKIKCLNETEFLNSTKEIKEYIERENEVMDEIKKNEDKEFKNPFFDDSDLD